MQRVFQSKEVDIDVDFVDIAETRNQPILRLRIGKEFVEIRLYRITSALNAEAARRGLEWRI